MSRTPQELGGITLLGNQKTQYPTDYAPEVLESFDNKHPDNDYFVKFICPEFTSLCPMTGQPDFATIVIRYIPDAKMVESKSLWGTDSFCTAPIRAEFRVNPCHIKDAADSTHAHDDTTFFKKTIKTYQIPSKS